MIFMANPAKIALSGSHTAKSRLAMAGPLADRISFFRILNAIFMGSGFASF